MANNELKEFRAESRAFAEKHLKVCAAELREWQDTAILRDGRVRELAALCGKFIANHDQLRVAESMINRAAIDAVAAPAQAEPSGALPELPPHPEKYHVWTDQERKAIEAYAKQAIEARCGKLSDARDVALAKINAIRNSIIGFQSVNWSEHVYPLVAALDEAGIEGEGYDVSRAKAQRLCDQINALEAELAVVRGQQGGGDAVGVVAVDLAADVWRNAERYQWLLDNYARGDGYSDIDDALNNGEPEKYLSPAIDAQIAAIPAKVGEVEIDPLTAIIPLGNGTYLKPETKTTGEPGWPMYNEHGLVRALNAFETLLVESVLSFSKRRAS